MTPGFEVFWAAYPRKVCKKAADQAWRKIDPDAELATQIVAAVYAQRLDDRERRFIPYPATWLHGERWTDEVTHALVDAVTVRRALGPDHAHTWRDRCPHEPTCPTPTRCALLAARTPVSA